MTKCIPSPHAETLSELVQRLSRPLSVRTAADGTTHCWLSKLGTDGVVYLLVPEEDTLCVHEAAVASEIADALAGHVAAGVLQPTDLDTMTSAIETARGTGVPVRIWDLIPQPFKDEARDWDDLVREGIFNQPGGMP